MEPEASDYLTLGHFTSPILDVDAYTGGYNLQIAFSTGVLAGENAAWQ